MAYLLRRCLGMAIVLLSWSGDINAQTGKSPTSEFLHLETSDGLITCALTGPKVVVDHLRSLVSENRFSDTHFCRVVPEYFIQGGCGLTKERSDKERVSFKLKPQQPKHDKPGVLTFAPYKDGTFARQFLILLRSAPWLDVDHAPIGKCTDLSIARGISRMPTLSKGLTRRPIRILSVVINQEEFPKPGNGLDK